MAAKINAAARRHPRGKKFLFLDVDGTMTDGRLYFVGGGAVRAFHSHDGQGIKNLLNAGVGVALVSAAGNDEVRARARALGVRHVHLNVADKEAAVKSILRAEKLTATEAVFMGDDLPDLAAMKFCGCGCAPADATTAALLAADYVTARGGGRGAVREVCDLMLSAPEKNNARAKKPSAATTPVKKRALKNN